uniref:Zinc finger protein-like 1 n=1 Tax=Mola mola TaxID=94237 RepID=A0A3Q3WI22_MOLML
MGLCKCPKRKVTNLFCFEHRVNVCEHCLVSNHNKCIVQSYLQWLQDSDYNPNCTLCNNPLTTEDTVRLVCYDVFHWNCLNNLASRLPLHTAPAGYQCPVCQGPVFPASNLASPVADVLKEQLASVNWARAGLGLPLVRVYYSQDQSHIYPSHSYNTSQSPPPMSLSPPAQEDVGDPRKNGTHDHTVVNFTSANTDTIKIHTASSPRKVYDTRDTGHSSVTQIDFDDDKYRRRPALNWFAQILKNRTGKKRTSFSWKQRVFILLLVGVLGFFTLIIVMAKLGRASNISINNDQLTASLF